VRGNKQVYEERFILASRETRRFDLSILIKQFADSDHDATEWERKVAALPAAEQVKAVAAKLKELNPGFDGRVAFIQNDVFLDPAFDGGVVAYVKDGVVIHLALDAAEVADLSPVRALTGLQRLNLDLRTKHDGKYRDLSPLRGLPLKALWFHCSLVSDLSPLKDMPLEELTCSGSGIRDLSPLKGRPLLILDVEQTQVRDLLPLRGMPVKSLACRETRVNDRDVIDQNLEALRTLKNLEQISIDVNDENHKVLRTLKLKDLKWINGKAVADFWKDLDEQTLEGWITRVAAMPAEEQVNAVVGKLKELNPDYHGNRDVSINKGVVTQFEVVTDQVTDISPVRAMKGLQILGCKGSGPGKGKLSDLVPLKGLKLKSLDCRYTRVTDLSPLRGMPLKEVQVDLELTRDAPVLRSIKTLEKINGEIAAEFWPAVNTTIVEAADYLAQGWKLADDDRWTEAKAVFEKAAATRPDDPQVWKWRGVIQAEGKRFEQAAAEFNKALDMTPRESRRWWGQAGEIDDRLCQWDDVYYRVAKLRPKDVNLRIARTCWFASRGRWKEAAKASEEVVALGPDDSWNWFMNAPLCLQVGDVEGYRRDCREMMKRFGLRENPQRDDLVAKTCLLAPEAVNENDSVGLLAGNAFPGTVNESAYHWYVVCKCLFEYRTGKFDDCVARVRDVLDAKPDHAARDATALVIKAMAEQKRGKPDEARAALKEARVRIEVNMPKVERGELFGDDWHDWLRCQILLREAEKLLEKNGKGEK
jgi:tetratricopeptide (TPR) repeat protein